MYVHLGGEVSIPSDLIVGVFNLDSISDTNTMAFMQQTEEAEQLELMSGDLPRSLIVTLERSYLSPLTSGTLLKRWQTNIMQGVING